MNRPLPDFSQVLVAPSIMCSDQARLGEELEHLAKVGCELFHFDIMDARFVPNMPMGLGVLSALRSITKTPFDVHLMVEDNDWFIEEIARIGADQIAVHAETATHLDRSLQLIRSHGMRAGVALNPATPLTALDWVVERLDFLLIMTVNPGYAGQKLVPQTIGKIRQAREYLTARGSSIPIEVDGNVSFENIPPMVAAGADLLVAGTSSIYHSDGSVEENMRRMREAIAAGLADRSAAGVGS